MLFIRLSPGWLVQRTHEICLLKTERSNRYAITEDGEPWMVRGKPLVCGIAEVMDRIGRRITRPLATSAMDD